MSEHTRDQAYWAGVLNKQFGAQAAMVLSNVQVQGFCTRNELSKIMGLGINVICGRVKELLDAGALREIGPTKDPKSGRMVENLAVVYTK